MRPGKPLVFGRLGAMPVLGLPGNPVSVGVTAIIFLGPAIRAMLGMSRALAATGTARLGRDLAAQRSAPGLPSRGLAPRRRRHPRRDAVRGAGQLHAGAVCGRRVSRGPGAVRRTRPRRRLGVHHSPRRGRESRLRRAVTRVRRCGCRHPPDRSIFPLTLGRTKLEHVYSFSFCSISGRRRYQPPQQHGMIGPCGAGVGCGGPATLGVRFRC